MEQHEKRRDRDCEGEQEQGELEHARRPPFPPRAPPFRATEGQLDERQHAAQRRRDDYPQPRVQTEVERPRGARFQLWMDGRGAQEPAVQDPHDAQRARDEQQVHAHPQQDAQDEPDPPAEPWCEIGAVVAQVPLLRRTGCVRGLLRRIERARLGGRGDGRQRAGDIGATGHGGQELRPAEDLMGLEHLQRPEVVRGRADPAARAADADPPVLGLEQRPGLGAASLRLADEQPGDEPVPPPVGVALLDGRSNVARVLQDRGGARTLVGRRPRRDLVGAHALVPLCF